MRSSSPTWRVLRTLFIMCAFGGLGLGLYTDNWYMFMACGLVCLLTLVMCFFRVLLHENVR